MESRGTALFIILLLLIGATAAVLIAENRRPCRSEQFQQLVGGLGFGPALDLSEDAFAFDPRLDGTCEQDYGPIPGGSCFCPRHSVSILLYPSPSIEDNGDVLSP